MANSPKPTVQLLDTSPEVKSFIYQQLIELEPFVTPETEVTVLAKDPRKLSIQLETAGILMSPAELSKMHRISITLKEDGAQIEEEALHEDIFEAIREAKTKLIKKLAAIQDKVITKQDRQEQINEALANHQIH